METKDWLILSFIAFFLICLYYISKKIDEMDRAVIYLQGKTDYANFDFHREISIAKKSKIEDLEKTSKQVEFSQSLIGELNKEVDRLIKIVEASEVKTTKKVSKEEKKEEKEGE